MPKVKHNPKGFNALARMLKRHKEDPDGFDKLYHQRSLVETAFSVTRKRLGANARAKSVCQGTILESQMHTRQPGRLDVWSPSTGDPV